MASCIAKKSSKEAVVVSPLTVLSPTAVSQLLQEQKEG